ncbi:hypothetical protein BLIN101_01149 [Brevibacterium linens]|uniref:Uncharacterized protein n=2 Tax=Brevibacterium linens TaxID=1703 RepID=A0A2H1IFK3_BRELN|nr:hypothetical protein BLIN101_01149 [Brevibacterium linens]
MVGHMDRIELTQDVLCGKVVTPIVLGMFANYEWDSIAMLRDTEDERRLIARIVVAGEAIEVLLDFPGNEENLYDMQERLVAEFRAFIDRSEFGARRTSEWEADSFNLEQKPAVVSRTPRPDFDGPPDCVQRRLRNGGRVMRVDRRRCVSAHRRS